MPRLKKPDTETETAADPETAAEQADTEPELTEFNEPLLKPRRRGRPKLSNEEREANALATLARRSEKRKQEYAIKKKERDALKVDEAIKQRMMEQAAEDKMFDDIVEDQFGELQKKNIALEARLNALEIAAKPKPKKPEPKSEPEPKKPEPEPELETLLKEKPVAKIIKRPARQYF